MAIVQIPSTWSSAHRPIIFEVDSIPFSYSIVNNSGKVRINLTSGFLAFDYPLLRRVYIPSGIYKGYHNTTAVRTASPNGYIDVTTDFIGADSGSNLMLCWNYRVRVLAGFPNYDTITEKQALYRPDGRVIFDLQENVKISIPIAPPVNGIDPSLFTWYKVEIIPDADLQDYLTGEGLSVFDVYGYDTLLYDFRALNSTADQSIINTIAAGSSIIADQNVPIFTSPRLNVFSRVFDSRVFTFFVNSISGVFNPILNPRTNDWINRYTAATGNAPNSTLISAVNQWFQSMAGVLNSGKILRLNWFIANDNQLLGAMVPLVNTHGGTTDTSFNFVNADFTTANGLQGNGVNKYLNTGFNPTLVTQFGLNDAGVIVYPSQNLQQVTNAEISTSPSSTIMINARSHIDYISSFLNAAVVASITNITDARGMLYIGRKAATSVQVFKNEILVDTIGSASTSKPNADLLLFRGGNNYITRRQYGYALTQYLNTVEYVTLLNATRTLFTAIGRPNY